MKGNPADEDDFGIVAEINMIPLIDVSLVLLIIFMVMTPILVQSQIKVNLPEAGASDAASEGDKIRVVVTQDGTAYLDGLAVSGDDLVNSLIAVSHHPDDDTLIVEADSEADFGHVVRVMDAAKLAGLKKIGVAVKDRPTGRGPSVR